jgi:DNA-binding CsgD family transcriptional regulator
MVPQDFLVTIAQEHGVSESEMRALSEAIEGNSPAAIAKKFGTRPEVIRNQLGGVYRKFQIPGAGPGKLAKLQQILMSRYQFQQTNADLPALNPPADTSRNPQTRQDWSEAPDVSGFSGRAAELELLTQWVNHDRCRFIAILGKPGIGKTALSVKLTEQVKSEFEWVLWCSLRYAPSIKDILGKLIQFLSGRQSTYPIEDIDHRISLLLEHLTEKRCLLILDSFETVLQSEQLVGQYREGYESYGELIKRLAEANHQSCVILTSQEKPVELEAFEGKNLPVRLFALPGLSIAEAEIILRSQGLTDTTHWEKLIQSYEGNPLELKLATTMIQDLFNGKVSDFLKRSTFVFGGIRTLLDQQFERLSESEKEVFYWLAIAQTSLLLEDLQKRFWLPLPEPYLLEALSSLKRRSLLETKIDPQGTLFYLQPVILEYTTTQLTEQICTEIRQFAARPDIKQIELLRSHALNFLVEKPAKSKPVITKSLVEITCSQLVASFRNITKLEDCLKQMLKSLEAESLSRVGYAIDNIKALLTTVNTL